MTGLDFLLYSIGAVIWIFVGLFLYGAFLDNKKETKPSASVTRIK